MELTTLSTLMKLVDENWPITPKEYPELAVYDPAQTLVKFGVSHVMRHQHKSIGVIEGALEDIEHGHSPKDFAKRMVLAAQKMFVNQLMLCVLLDISAEQLSEYVRNWARQQHPLSCSECGFVMEPVGAGAWWKCRNCSATKIAEIVLHPESHKPIWGRKLAVGDIIQKTDVLPSSVGEWESRPQAAGTLIQTGCMVLWVRPVGRMGS